MTIFKTLYKDYNGKDIMQHFQLHCAAELWAKEHGVKVRYGDAYIFANVYELESEEDALAFTLKFGELM
jgi:hypothetical protein